MWIPVGLGRDVPAEATRAVVLEGRELALWRAESGALQLWKDRCPHRGMRLSFGFVRGESLNCLYHGWQYGTGASCQRIPAHPDLVVPATIRATAFTVIEAGGLIWTSARPDALPPSVPDVVPLASVAVDAPADALPLPKTPACQSGEMELDRMKFYIGWHRVDSWKVMLHCATVGQVDRQAALRAVWALRDRVEQWAA